MRLTVHLKEVPQVQFEKGKKIFNTLSFDVNSVDHGNLIINDLEKSGKKISKHSFCGDTKSWGRPFKNQSK
jgi:hypothetical protein